MTAINWSEAALSKAHDRAGFDCGDDDLNTYLKRFARQNHANGGAKCFVATPDADPTTILGYYTLSPASLVYARAPKSITAKLARYDVPVFRLGRLAVSARVQGRGLGGALLLRAGARCLSVAEVVGGVALLIDAKSPRAAAFYQSYGAVALQDSPLTLILPLSTLADALFSSENG